jgi:CTP synthase (UTP-ammonia lyase)
MSLLRLALVGDRQLDASSHAAVTRAIAGLEGAFSGVEIESTWILTTAVDSSLDEYDGVWLLGSPYESEAGVITAAGVARRNGIPLLGTCGGLQLAVTEFATQVAGMDEEEVLVPLSCSLGSNECVVLVTSGSLLEQALGSKQTRETYHCTYGLNPLALQTLTDHGMRFTGVDLDGVVRVAELPGHPFFLGTLFQPELSVTANPHPVIRAWAGAACERSRMKVEQ